MKTTTERAGESIYSSLSQTSVSKDLRTSGFVLPDFIYRADHVAQHGLRIPQHRAKKKVGFRRKNLLLNRINAMNMVNHTCADLFYPLNFEAIFAGACKVFIHTGLKVWKVLINRKQRNNILKSLSAMESKPVKELYRTF